MNKEEIENNIWKSQILGILSEEEREERNKREIEESKKCLEETIQNTYAKGKAIKLDNLKHYIQQLEFENTALKAEHNHNIDKIKELKQKETILDKVTDKLNKEQRSDYEVLNKTEHRLRKMNKEEYNQNGEGRYLNDLRDILLNRIEYQQELLNIIEGESANGR